jgi:hypothetical protein
MRSIVLFLTLLVATAPAAETNAVGTWSCTARTPDGREVPWTLQVTAKEAKLAAVIKTGRWIWRRKTPGWKAIR